METAVAIAFGASVAPETIVTAKTNKRMTIKEALEHELFRKFTNSEIVVTRKTSNNDESIFKIYTITEENIKKYNEYINIKNDNREKEI